MPAPKNVVLDGAAGALARRRRPASRSGMPSASHCGEAARPRHRAPVGVELTDQRCHAGHVRRRHRRPADPDPAGAVGVLDAAPGGGRGPPTARWRRCSTSRRGSGRTSFRASAPRRHPARSRRRSDRRCWSSRRAWSRQTADTVTTPGSSAGATRQLLRTSRVTAVSGGQSGLMVVGGRVTQVLGLVAGRSHDHDAALLRVPRSIRQVLRGSLAARRRCRRSRGTGRRTD